MIKINKSDFYFAFFSLPVCYFGLKTKFCPKSTFFFLKKYFFFVFFSGHGENIFLFF